MSSPQPVADPQVAQAGLAAALRIALALLWPTVDFSDLRAVLPAFKAAIALEVRQHAQASASLATGQYRDARTKAGVLGAFTPIPADPPTVEQIAASVDWAVQPLWNANVAASFGGQVVTLPSEAPAAGEAIADAKARVAASAERLMLSAGRNTIIDNARRDQKAKGWARIPEADPCWFCMMLATRGLVYRSEQTASFHPHDNCRCHAEPVFTAYEASADIRQAQQLWATSTRGLSGPAARLAFRRAYEGRTAPAK